jgi:hypothetical protein
MLRPSRQRLGLRECRAAWLLGLTVQEYRALERGEASIVTSDLWSRMVNVFEWPRSPATEAAQRPQQTRRASS